LNQLTTELVLSIAEVTHTANKAYCESIGDHSQVGWEFAPDWQKNSAVNGVNGVLLDGRGPERSHEGWMAEKIAAGWVYGATKDPEAKTHPCLVPYAELPPEQKRKDSLFVTIVNTMACYLDIDRGETEIPMPAPPGAEN
jgi:hypothetical protein